MIYNRELNNLVQCHFSMMSFGNVHHSFYSFLLYFNLIKGRRNAGVVAHKGLLYVIGGDDGTSNLSSVEVIII